jgi:hypothetical protein
MRLRQLGALLGFVLFCSSAWATPSLKGQIKGQREKGRLTAISVRQDFTITRGGKLLLNRGGSPGALQSLGAYRITSATPTQDGRFEVGFLTMPGTPLARMVGLMSRLGRAPAIAGEKLPTERFSVGGPGVGGPGAMGQIKVSIQVLTGESVLARDYAKELVSGRGLRTPSYNNYLREPAGR